MYYLIFLAIYLIINQIMFYQYYYIFNQLNILELNKYT